MRSILVCLAVLLGGAVMSSAGFAQTLTERNAVIYSEGVRMSGAVFYAAEQEGRKLPAVILSHGWGGTAALLRPEAERFARAGFFVLAFDYRGWGGSEGRWVHDEAPGAKAGDRRELREVVDPLDQATDVANAVHWIMGEPMVDTGRVGLWGTSFSGGLMVYVAARDPRIRAVVAQVAAFGWARSAIPAPMLERALSDATRRARGEIGYPPPGRREVGNLYGAPIRESFLRYAPVEDAAGLNGCALLIIDAEKEELFDLREHGERVFQRAPEPKRRVVIPGITHYGIYSSAREQAIGLAVDWMTRHLAAPAGR